MQPLRTQRPHGPSASYRTCSKCGEEKPTTEFFNERRGRDGLQAHCKLCDKAKAADYRARNPQIVRAANARSRIKNKDARYAYMKRWRAANPEHLRAQIAAWQRANRDAVRVSFSRYRAAKHGVAENTLTLDEWLVVLETWAARCAYCGSPDKISIDHVIPLSSGGGNTKENVVPACLPCNLKKWAGEAPPFRKRPS